MPEALQRNTELAIGLGTGLGYIFKYLDEDFKQRAYLEAKNNVQFAIGLYYWFGFWISLSSRQICKGNA
jgi:hypothetical protein